MSDSTVNWLWAAGSADLSLLQNIHTSYTTHTFYSIGTTGLFLKVGRP